ncbi:hypothetical protein N0V85_004543 [Neurospora sp. IMI 360204]|nr:hypothetical protein N0V85_004543 [Neurospora sp. IMI 360204]
MFKVLQHHRALARACDQQEVAVDTPFHGTYQQEAHPNYRVPFRYNAAGAKLAGLGRSGIEFPSATNNLETQRKPNEEETAHKKVNVRDLDKDMWIAESKDSGSIVNTSTVGQNDDVATITKAFSNLNITPNIKQPCNGSSYDYGRMDTIMGAPKQSSSITDSQVPARPATPTTQSLHNEAQVAEFEKNRRKRLYEQKIGLPYSKGPDRATEQIGNKPTSKPRLSRREQRRLESREWSSNAFIDDKGRLDTKMNRLGKMRKRLHHRCTWVRKPFSLARYAREMEKPVPFVMLTDPEGYRFFLEDDKKYSD